MSRKRNSSRYRKGKSRVLYQITALVVVLFILSGTIIFFSFRSSQNHQIKASTDNLISTYNKNVSDCYEFINRLFISLTLALFPDASNPANVNAILAGQQTPVQGLLNQELYAVVDEKVLGAELAFAVLMPSAQAAEPVVIASSDSALINSWQMPSYLSEAIQRGDAYLYLPDGMPELNFPDETLALFKSGDSAAVKFPYTMVTVASVHDEVMAANAFYEQQRKDASFALALILLVALALLSLFSYLGLSYLIHKRITKPIDELAIAADEVIQGNLDVEIEIRKGEEFEGLKYAFRELLHAFRAALARSAGEEKVVEGSKPPKYKKGRSGALYQMTAFLVILFIISWLGIFFSFQSVRNLQFGKSVDYLMDDYAQTASGGYDHLYQLFKKLAEVMAPPTDENEEILAVFENRLSPTRKLYSDWLKQMIDEGFMGASTMFDFLMPSSFIPKAEVIMSSDESLVHKWDVPDYLVEAVREDRSYLYLPNGIPELGLSDEMLVILKKGTVGGQIDDVFAGAGSVHDKVVAANDFYNKQKRDSAIALALIMLISAALLSLCSFFGLRYLIHKRITKPIDELSAAAEQVADGNLDVEIEVHPGEEFEGLKSAFKELLDTMRSMIDRSINEKHEK